MHALLLISCLAALLACSSVQAAERQPATTFSGHTVGVLTEQSSQPSSYGYEKKERKLCLSESQLSNCGVGSIPGGFASFQTDFDCCQGKREDQEFTTLGLSLGNCVWQTSFNMAGDMGGDMGGGGGMGGGMGNLSVKQGMMSRTLDPVPLTPTLSRVGGISAVCQLSSAIDKCGGPDCAKLTVSLQGVVYQSLARSHEDTFFHTLGPDGGNNTCCKLQDSFGITLQEGACCSCTDKEIPCECCLDCCEGCGGIDTRTTLPCAACCEICTGPPGAARNRKPAKQREASKANRRQAGGDGSAEGVVGEALIAMGTATIVSTGRHSISHTTKIEPVGTFQYVLDWNSDVAIERAPDATLSELPWIHPGSFEITWREEEESKDYYKA